MKTELIKYHRKQSEAAADAVAMYSPSFYLLPYIKENAEFHKRAVEWLESLDEGLAISASAERQIQRENLERLNRQVNG